MTAPIIEAITPARGHTGGRTLVEINGQHFRLRPPPAPANAPLPPPPPTMQVLFGGVPALAVQVVSETLLRVSTPMHAPDRFLDTGSGMQQTDFGTVDVVVQNIDDDGAVIAGEVDTAPAAYSFVRPELGPYKGSWSQTITSFKTLLQVLLLENVAVNPSVDYEADSGEPLGFVQLAKGPGIALVNLGFPVSTEELERVHLEVDLPNDYVLIRRAPLVIDITATLICASASENELVNLCEQVTHVFRDFGAFQVPRDPADPTQGFLEYRMVMSADGLKVSQRFGNSDMMTAEAPILLKNITSSDMPGAPLEGVPRSPKWLGHQGTIGITRRAARIRTTAAGTR